jgi:hypothetical protein
MHACMHPSPQQPHIPLLLVCLPSMQEVQIRNYVTLGRNWANLAHTECSTNEDEPPLLLLFFTAELQSTTIVCCEQLFILELDTDHNIYILTLSS